MKIVKLNDLDPEVNTLIEASITARDQAYAIFSAFKVGAAVQSDDGTIHTGCNIENSSYSLTICAERTAIVKAVSEGHANFVKLSVCAEKDDDFVSPCGACRQMAAEFVKTGTDLKIYLIKPKRGDVLETTLNELLPLYFKL